MKPSKYNFFSYTSEGERIIYNALSQALAKIDDIHYREYKLIEKGEENQSTLSPGQRDKICEPLLKGRFIYPDDSLDEIEFISFAYNKNKYSDRGLNLTIAPTMDCNFGCRYCYEKWMKINRQSYLDEGIEKDIKKFVELQLANKRHLSVSWYGGEPLLAKAVLYRMSGFFLELCEKKNCVYSSSIVTNGYYLDKDVVDNLVKCHVKSAQITIDGPAEIHDSRRFDKKNGPSFDVIMKNIAYAKEFMAIFIRVNIDKENIDGVEPLLDYLKENDLTQNVAVYMGRVSDCNLELSGEYVDLLLESKDYFEKKKEILDRAITKKKMNWVGSFPSPQVIPCGAVNIDTYALDPEGYVYKCWEVLGNREEAIFHVSNPGMLNEKHLKWIKWDPKADEECLDCKFLPLCNGGCVLSALKGRKECTHWKDNLDDMLTLLAYKQEHLEKKKND